MGINCDFVDLDFFYKKLVALEEIKEALEERLGSKVAKDVIKDLRKGISPKEIKVDFENILYDYVDNYSDEVKVLDARGGHGHYPVSIMKCGPVYWVYVQESDPLRYFKTKKEAISCAKSYFEAS